MQPDQPTVERPVDLSPAAGSGSSQRAQEPSAEADPTWRQILARVDEARDDLADVVVDAYSLGLIRGEQRVRSASLAACAVHSAEAEADAQAYDEAREALHRRRQALDAERAQWLAEIANLRRVILGRAEWDVIPVKAITEALRIGPGLVEPDAQVRTVSGLCEARPDGVCTVAAYGHRHLYHGGRPVPPQAELRAHPHGDTCTCDDCTSRDEAARAGWGAGVPAGPAVVFKLVPYATNAHTECRLYAGPDRDHLALCGDLRLRHHEYSALQDALNPPQQPAAPLAVERQCLIEEPHPGHRWYADGAQLICGGQA